MIASKPPPRVRIELHPTQASFLDSRALFRGFVGGRGTGKSWIGAYDLIRRAKAGRLYMVGAPTYRQLEDSTLRSFLELARRLNVLQDGTRGVNAASMKCRLRNGAEIIFRSAENPERFRGPNLSGVWIDEASLVEQSAKDIALACLREGGEMGWLTATFTPKGKFHWTYTMFGATNEVGEPVNPDTELFHCATDDNPFLPEQFKPTLAAQYTRRMQAQELSGLFLDAEGALFNEAWFRGKYREVREWGWNVRRVRYWDKAATTEAEGGRCWTCGVLIARITVHGKPDRLGKIAPPTNWFMIEDVIRGQWTPHERDTIIANVAARDRADLDGKGPPPLVVVEQEPGSGGKESAQATIGQLAGYSVYADLPGKLGKFQRAEPLAAQTEAGNVYLRRAPWNRDLIAELCSADPQSASQVLDQFDACSGGFNYVNTLGQPVRQEAQPEPADRTRPTPGQTNAAQDRGLYGRGRPEGSRR